MGRIFDGVSINTEAMLNYSNNNFSSVTEAYIGKTKELIAAEKFFDTLIQKYKEDPGIQINDSKEMKAINELFKKQFGFNEFAIVWIPDMIVNGFTFGQSTITQAMHGKSFKLDKSRGYYDVDHAMSVIVCVYIGCLTMTNIDGSALVGLVLHEIGHNFDNSIYVFAKELTLLQFGIFQPLMGDLFKIGFGKVAEPASVVLGKLEGYNSNTNLLVRTAIKINRLIQSIERKLTQTNNLLEILKGTVKLVAKISPISVGREILGIDGEFHADEVAAMYGYGKGQSEFLFGATYYDYGEGDYRHYVPSFLMPLVDLSELAFKSFLFTANPLLLLNCHPSDRVRARNLIKKLERDLANADYPPKMKAMLQKDLEEQKKLYKEFIDTKTLEKGRPFRYALNKFYEALGGGSVHNLVPRKHI